MSIPADIIVRTETILGGRPNRAPDFETENRALLTLAGEMADRPDNVLKLLCDLVMSVCDAESAGVSLIVGDPENGDFQWPAISGAWAPYTGGGMPRDASPCGNVVAYDTPLLFHDVVAQFPAAAAAQPPIAEILLAPFHLDGVPVGTVWAIDHSGQRQFDLEDRRLLQSLAKFASAAYQTTRSDKAARDAEARVQLANRELAHRIKNMLTMVQAIASQTFRRSEQTDQTAVFNMRLRALADAQDLLIETSNESASVGDIVSAVLRSLSPSARVTASGPPMTLGPRAALALALAVHELGTNATKYGALSVPTGEVEAAWAIEPGDIVSFVWRERGGPVVVAPSKTGFGAKLISMGLLGDGGVELSYAPEGVTARFVAPLDRARAE